MNLLRFRITMDDYPEVVRTIEVQDTKTFEDLHHAILESVNFDSSQLASFFVCNDEWEKKIEITLIDMDADDGDMTPIMRETELGEFVAAKGQKLVYEYDFVLMWRFFLEVEDVSEFTGIPDHFPRVVDSVGEAPGQYDTLDRYPSEVTDEDAHLIQDLKSKNMDYFHLNEGGDHEDDLGLEEDDDYFGSGGGMEGDDDEFGHGRGRDDWY